MRKLGLALLLIIVAQPVMHAGSAETSSLHVQCAPASQSLLHLIQASPALSSCFTGCTQSESSCQFSGSVASLCCRPARVQTTAWQDDDEQHEYGKISLSRDGNSPPR